MLGRQLKERLKQQEAGQEAKRQDHENMINARIEASRLQQESGRKQGKEDLVELDSLRGMDAATHGVDLVSWNALRQKKAECGHGLHVQVETNKQQPTAEANARKEPRRRKTI